jgi:hypothetical protein
VASARQSIGKGARNTGGTIANVADKAKVPLVAGGAALAGLAGGAALAGRGRKGMSLPRLRNGGPAAKAFGSAAKEVAKTGYRVGELTAEVRKTREQLGKK